MSSEDKQIKEISQGILLTIKQTKMKDLPTDSEVTKILHLTDVHHAKNLVEHMDKVSTQSERNVGKIAVIKALLLSSWLQRLYFFIRSIIMGILSSVLYLGFHSCSRFNKLFQRNCFGNFLFCVFACDFKIIRQTNC